MQVRITWLLNSIPGSQSLLAGILHQTSSGGRHVEMAICITGLPEHVLCSVISHIPLLTRIVFTDYPLPDNCVD